MSTLQPKIYVACLSSYNAGHLHGAWIDATQPEEDIIEEINNMLKTSPSPYAEEWAIHDQDDFGGIQLQEYETLENISELACFIEEHGELGVEVLRGYTSGDIDSARTLIEECYQGEYDNRAHFASTLTEEITDLPDYIERYIDYDKMGRDFLCSDYFAIEIKRSLHVFRNE